jgi:hypothetical protein
MDLLSIQTSAESDVISSFLSSKGYLNISHIATKNNTIYRAGFCIIADWVTVFREWRIFLGWYFEGDKYRLGKESTVGLGLCTVYFFGPEVYVM